MTDKKYCPDCGHDVSADQNFCEECGSQLDHGTTEDSRNDPNPRTENQPAAEDDTTEHYDENPTDPKSFWTFGDKTLYPGILLGAVLLGGIVGAGTAEVILGLLESGQAQESLPGSIMLVGSIVLLGIFPAVYHSSYGVSGLGASALASILVALVFAANHTVDPSGNAWRMDLVILNYGFVALAVLIQALTMKAHRLRIGTIKLAAMTVAYGFIVYMAGAMGHFIESTMHFGSMDPSGDLSESSLQTLHIWGSVFGCALSVTLGYAYLKWLIVQYDR